MTPPVYLTNQLVDFADGGNVFAFAFLDVNGNASITTSTLTDGVHNITAIYGGNEGFLFSISPVLTQVVMHSGAASSSNTLLTPTPQTFFRQSANFNVLTPGSGGISPTGNVILLEGNRQLGPLLTLNSGPSGLPSYCSYRTPLPVGTHQVRAVYLGDGNFNGSVSSVQVVNTSPRPKPR